MSSINVSLSNLVKGILYSSESDYPFTVLEWGKLDDDEVKATIIKHYGTTAEPTPLAIDSFFSKYIHRMEMSGDEVMIATIKDYQKLYDFIKANFVSADVYRCGSMKVGIYMVFKTSDNEVFALTTISIET